MKIIDCQQGTEEWYMARRGLPTASRFSSIVTPTGQPSKSRLPYICELIADMSTNGAPLGIESYTSRAMQAGIDAEPDARRWYEFETGAKVDQVGFCLHDDERYGSSPDGTIDDDGTLELKCPTPHKHVEYLIADRLPPEYAPQCHGHLLVTGRKYCDFMSYAIGLPPLIIRVEWSDYTLNLQHHLNDFCDIFDKWKQDERFTDLFNRTPYVPTEAEQQRVEDDLF